MRTRAFLRVSSILTVLATMLPAPAPAQITTNRWTITLDLGLLVAGPAQRLAGSFRERGYTTFGGGGCFIFFCGEPHDHPHSEIGAQGVLSVRYRVRQRLSIGAAYWTGPLGGAAGLRNGSHLRADWNAVGLGILAWWIPRPSIRFGAGPGIQKVTSLANDLHRTITTLLIEAGVVSSTRSRVFFDVSVGARLTPSSIPGPVLGDGSQFSQVNGSYVGVNVGLGLRLGPGPKA